MEFSLQLPLISSHALFPSPFPSPSSAKLQQFPVQNEVNFHKLKSDCKPNNKSSNPAPICIFLFPLSAAFSRIFLQNSLLAFPSNKLLKVVR